VYQLFFTDNFFFIFHFIIGFVPCCRGVADDEDLELGQLFEGEDERPCMFCQTFGDQEVNVRQQLHMFVFYLV